MQVNGSFPRIHLGRVLNTYEARASLDGSLALARVTFEEEPWSETGETVPPLFTAGMTIDADFECHNTNIEAGSIVGQTGGANPESPLVQTAALRN